MAIRAAIVGGTGYGGMELVRYLLGHPEVKITAITSRTETGALGDVHPHLRGLTDLGFTAEKAVDLARSNDVLFFAAPHGVAAKEVPAVLTASASIKVIDLSGDFRLRDPAAYPIVYGYEHPAPALLQTAVYGLPECGSRYALREPGCRLVANPGCHASATILALFPLVRGGAWHGDRTMAAVVSVTGSSGSGAKPVQGTHHPERFANFRAYKPLEHPHLSEIRQTLVGQGMHAGGYLGFVPCSGPFARGIAVTAVVDLHESGLGGILGDAALANHLRSNLRDIYGQEPFVRIVPETAEVRAVAGTNFADIGVTAKGEIACVTVAIDNLGKGMAGTAIQNMNLLFGLPETTGLMRPGAGL